MEKYKGRRKYGEKIDAIITKRVKNIFFYMSWVFLYLFLNHMHILYLN